MLVLAHRAKRYGFELRRMPPRQSLLIEDVAFNSFLSVANKALVRIARDADVTIDPELHRSFDATDAALEQLWDEPSGEYYSRNTLTGDLIKVPTVATFLPLWTKAVPAERAAELIARLREPSGFWPAFPVPSVPTDAPHFDAHRYWKGPTWINMNWAIVHGLRMYDELETPTSYGGEPSISSSSRATPSTSPRSPATASAPRSSRGLPPSCSTCSAATA